MQTWSQGWDDPLDELNWTELKQSYILQIDSTSPGCIILYVIHICIFHIFICIFISYIYLSSICQYVVKNFCIYIHEDWGSCREILNDKFNVFNGARNFLFFVVSKMLFKEYVYIIWVIKLLVEASPNVLLLSF